MPGFLDPSVFEGWVAYVGQSYPQLTDGEVFALASSVLLLPTFLLCVLTAYLASRGSRGRA